MQVYNRPNIYANILNFFSQYDNSSQYVIKTQLMTCSVKYIEAYLLFADFNLKARMKTMKNFNSENFLRELEQKHWDNVYCFEDPNKMWEIWKCILMATIDEHAPFRLRRVSNRKSPWITNDLRHQIFNRDYLKKKAVSINDPEAWGQYRQARNQINNAIKKAKRAYFTENLNLHRGDMKKTWKLINDLSSRSAFKPKRISEVIVNEQVVTSPADMAEAFNNYFSNVGKNLADEIPLAQYEPGVYLNPTDTRFSLKLPTVDKVYNLLRTIDEKKCVGLDKIPNKLLKMAANVVAPSLTAIFSASICTGIFPQEWKASRVSPVYKNGSRNNPSNYRPISVIPTVAKIFEKIVYDQLYEYLDSHNLLNASQSGFRSLHSTLTALLEATNSWSVNIDNGLVNGVVFIDLKKAFDTIDHKILLQKLENYGVDPNGLKWFKSYLTDRTQKCRVNDHLSNSKPVTCGVPQGSILGPLLFLIYINDLPHCLNYAMPRMFADDTNVSYAADSLNELQNVLNSELKSLHNWLITNRLSLNIAKTEFMTIGSRQKLRTIDDVINIKINECEINRVDSVKSLGVYIDNHLTWTKHIDKISKKIASAIGALKRIRPYITTNTAVQVYQTLIQPHFDYCCSVWDGLGETLSCKMQKLQNRAARVSMRANYDASAGILLDALHWDNLSLRREKLKAGLVFKTLKGNVPLYLQNMFSVRGIGYNIRNSEMRLNLPKPRTNYLKRSFSYSGALLWNSLPQDIRKLQSFAQFRKAIAEYYSN